MKKILLLLFIIIGSFNRAFNQDIIKLGEKTAKKVQRKVDSGINRGIDKVLNDAEKEIRNSGKSKKEPSKGKSSGNSSKSPTGSQDGNNSVQEKYDFKPFGKPAYSFNANSLNKQEDTNIYFNQAVELVQLDNQKGKWIKLEPNNAYCPKIPQPFFNNWAIEINMIPQINFDAGNEINIGIALVDSLVFEQFFNNTALNQAFADSLEDYSTIQLNKPKSKDELNIVIKSKKAGSDQVFDKKARYFPRDAPINKNMFAISNSGTITKIYYCNKKITSFQHSGNKPKKVILFVLDESNESSLYVQNLSITTD